uniref:Tumor necrosis factor receptor-associated factor-like protein n=1 Tax=Rhipicephalus zambeziensis TaxID=60191 RepID=A0A224YRW9_9ACAR
MIPEVHPYTLSGFSENLDWRTLDFVKPIDDIRVCSACGFVARKTAFLPCRHVLCEPCYEQWKPEVKVCFLDGELCPEKEVHWMEFPEEKMMTREVRCWNRENGCEIVTDISRIAEHFHRDCAYHSACCPKCSSTVLKKDIIAHLESRCANHVLRARWTTPPMEGELKELKAIREGVRALGIAFQNASHNDELLVTSFQGMTVKDKENVTPLSKMAAEAAQMLEVTKQTLSEVERSSEGNVNHIADVKTFKESVCADLDEIKSATDELRSCETSDQHEMREHENCVEKFQALMTEVQSMSCMLGEWKNNVIPEAAVVESAAADGLSEVLSLEIDSFWSSRRSSDGHPLDATVRVFENETKLPVKVLWCVHRWSLLINAMKERNFVFALTTITVGDRYKVNLRIIHAFEDKLLGILANVYRADAILPKNATLLVINTKKSAAENETNLTEFKFPAEGMPTAFITLNRVELERSGILRGKGLKVCFTFSY